MSADALQSLAVRARALSDALWAVDSRADAVDWMATADALLGEMARALQIAAETTKP